MASALSVTVTVVVGDGHPATSATHAMISDTLNMCSVCVFMSYCADDWPLTSGCWTIQPVGDRSVLTLYICRSNQYGISGEQAAACRLYLRYTNA